MAISARLTIVLANERYGRLRSRFVSLINIRFFDDLVFAKIRNLSKAGAEIS